MTTQPESGSGSDGGGDAAEEHARREYRISVVALLVTAFVGVVGPALTLWATDRQTDKQFVRDLQKDDRTELRAVLDEGAELLHAVRKDQIEIFRRRNEDTLDSYASRDYYAFPEEVDQRMEAASRLTTKLLLRVGRTSRLLAAYEGARRAYVQSAIALREADWTKSAKDEVDDRLRWADAMLRTFDDSAAARMNSLPS